MIHDGIYKVIVDNTLDDLKAFKLYFIPQCLWEVQTLWKNVAKINEQVESKKLSLFRNSVTL